MNAERHHAEEGRAPAPGTEPAHPTQEAEEERFLRPFAVDAGVATHRPSRPVEDLDLLSLVVAARTPGGHEWLRPEREAILAHARRARTVAELAAEVRLPMGQVRTMAAEMLGDGSLQRCGPSRPLEHVDILHSVLVGLRAL